MSFLRKIGKGLTGTILSLLIISLLGVQFSLYFINQEFLTQAVKEQIRIKIENQMMEKNITGEEIIKFISATCEKNQGKPIQIMGFQLECERIKNRKFNELVEEVTSAAAKNITSSLFKRKIDCEMVTCLAEGKLDALFSEKGMVFLEKMRIYLFIAIILVSIFFILLSPDLSTVLKSYGYMLLFSVLPLIIGNYILPNFLQSLVPEQIGYVEILILKRIEEFNRILWILLTASLLLLTSGYILKKKEKKEI